MIAENQRTLTIAHRSKYEYPYLRNHETGSEGLPGTGRQSYRILKSTFLCPGVTTFVKYHEGVVEK